jgi:hypothetical protein
MRRSISKVAIAGLAALAMSATMLCTTIPASAVGGFHGSFGGFRPGFGGFHSGFGGFHPGFGAFRPGFGVHPGFSNGFVAFRPGFRPFFANRRFFFHPGFFVNGVWINGWWGPSYGGCWSYEPSYDAAGNYLGYSYVDVCS